MKILRYLPIEIYILLLPALVILSAFIFWANGFVNGLNPSDFINSLYQLMLLGSQQINFVFIVLWILIIFYLISPFKKPDFSFAILSKIGSLLAINVFIGLMSLILGMSTLYLFYLAPLGRVVEFTLLIDSVERALFGGLPMVPLINYLSGSILETAIIYSYIGLSIMLAVCIFVTIFSSKKIFRLTVVSFFLAFIIALPFYVALPVISPDGLYVAKILPVPNTDLLIARSDTFNWIIEYSQKVFISPNRNFYAVSSLPSLHAAWGVIIFWGIYLTRKKLLSVLFGGWLFLNLIGTFYSLQHYAVDTIAGVLLGVLVIYLANFIIRKESTYYIGFDWYSISDLLIELKEKSKSGISDFYNKHIKKILFYRIF